MFLDLLCKLPTLRPAFLIAVSKLPDMIGTNAYHSYDNQVNVKNILHNVKNICLYVRYILHS